MKQLKLILSICLVGMMTLTSCMSGKYNAGDRMPSATSAEIDTVSYSLGMYFGKMISTSDFGELNLSQLQKGMNDVLNEKETKLDENNIMQYIQNHLTERQAYVSEKRVEENAKFFEENKTKEGVVETESGLQYKIVKEGEGISPEATDTVEVNYKGTFLDGKQFDSSYDRGETAKFALNQVIPGWSEGLQYAKEGGNIIIYVPVSLGYGERPQGPIPGNSALIFDVELVKVFKAAPVEETEVKK